MTIKEMVQIKKRIGSANPKRMRKNVLYDMYYGLVNTFDKTYVDIYLADVYNISIDMIEFDAYVARQLMNRQYMY